NSMKADLVVIGTHGRSGFERLVLGSVAEKTLRKAVCRVRTVPKRVSEAVSASPVLYKRILCPVDFSESSSRALQYAVSLAEESDRGIVVLHVVAHEFELKAGTDYDAGMTVKNFLEEREHALLGGLQEV